MFTIEVAMSKKGGSKKHGERMGHNAFNGKYRQNGGSIRSMARVKYEVKRMGKFGAASRVRRIEITDDIRQQYEKDPQC